MKDRIPIIIPAYEPDDRLLVLLRSFKKEDCLVVLVDDGSGEQYKAIFQQAKDILQEKVILLTHEVNRGKGRALKTAFSYVLEHFKDAIGVVTADSDGQHNLSSIKKVAEAIEKDPKALVLGVRCFDQEGIPWKSVFGNKLTAKVLTYISGIKISDTQTGLRGIPRDFMEKLLTVPGERFEFETEMLVESAGVCKICEVPIETIYDSVDNHQTHFNPIADSIKIYRVLGKRFLKYVFSSLSASLLDLLAFFVICSLISTESGVLYVSIATILARIISATYNYIFNYRIVFRSNASVTESSVKYAALAIIQMALSALLVTIGVTIFRGFPEIVIKAVVDTVLFFISYKIQQTLVFKKKMN